MGALKTLFVMLYALIVGIICADDQSSIQQCKYADKECILKLCNEMFRRSADGIPEFGLVATNPYEIRNVTVETGANSPMNIKIQFKRANITGISDYRINKIVGFDKDPRTSKFEMYGSVKLASISGPYRISGKFLLLPISGSGHAEIHFENLKLKVVLKCDVETRNGRDYLILKKMIINMDTDKMRVNFENLFNNKELSDNMNAVLNENGDLLFKGLQETMQNVVGDAMQKIFAPINENLAYADFFAKDD